MLFQVGEDGGIEVLFTFTDCETGYKITSFLQASQLDLWYA